MRKNTIKPEIAGSIATRMGVIRESDKSWFEFALECFASGATVEEAVAYVEKQRQEGE